MEISSFAPILATVTPFIVEYVKHNPKIQEITPETKGRLIALATLLSSGSTVLTGLVDGSIDGSTINMGIESVWNAAVAFGLTQGVYNILKWVGVFGKSEE